MITYHPFEQHNPPLFSILIPTWNNLELLRCCIDSIRKNSRHQHQIVLHVNEGIDGTRTWAEQQRIDHTYSTVNCGVCYAVNAAFSLATSDYIVYLNDDMYVCPDWDHYLWEEIQKSDDDNFFFSSTCIEPVDVGKGCALTPFSYGRNPGEFKEELLLADFRTFTYQDWNGSSWPPNVVHRRMWELVGGYSTEFFPGFYSDPDFSMKLWQAGVRNFKGVAASRVYHFLEASTTKVKRRKVKQANCQFLNKWGMSARTFNRFYLRMGSGYVGPLPEPEDSVSLRIELLRCALKKLLPV